MGRWVTGEHEAATGRVIGAAIAVHRELGPGFVESVYHRAMELELRRRRIPFASESEVEVIYDGVVVGRHRLDLIVEHGIVVELKAVHALEAVHFAQLRSYLKATHQPIGLLLNFGGARMVIKRVILNTPPASVLSDPPSPPNLPRLQGPRAVSDPSFASGG